MVCSISQSFSRMAQSLCKILRQVSLPPCPMRMVWSWRLSKVGNSGAEAEALTVCSEPGSRNVFSNCPHCTGFHIAAKHKGQDCHHSGALTSRHGPSKLKRPPQPSRRPANAEKFCSKHVEDASMRIPVPSRLQSSDPQNSFCMAALLHRALHLSSLWQGML